MIDKFVVALNSAGLPEVTLGALVAFLFTAYSDIIIEELKQLKKEREHGNKQ